MKYVILPLKCFIIILAIFSCPNPANSGIGALRSLTKIPRLADDAARAARLAEDAARAARQARQVDNIAKFTDDVSDISKSIVLSRSLRRKRSISIEYSANCFLNSLDNIAYPRGSVGYVGLNDSAQCQFMCFADIRTPPISWCYEPEALIKYFEHEPHEVIARIRDGQCLIAVSNEPVLVELYPVANQNRLFIQPRDNLLIPVTELSDYRSVEDVLNNSFQPQQVNILHFFDSTYDSKTHDNVSLLQSSGARTYGMLPSNNSHEYLDAAWHHIENHLENFQEDIVVLFGHIQGDNIVCRGNGDEILASFPLSVAQDIVRHRNRYLVVYGCEAGEAGAFNGPIGTIESLAATASLEQALKADSIGGFLSQLGSSKNRIVLNNPVAVVERNGIRIAYVPPSVMATGSLVLAATVPTRNIIDEPKPLPRVYVYGLLCAMIPAFLIGLTQEGRKADKLRIYGLFGLAAVLGTVAVFTSFGHSFTIFILMIPFILVSWLVSWCALVIYSLTSDLVVYLWTTFHAKT